MSNLNGLTANRIEIKNTSNWSGVLGMAVCAFAMVAAEFLPVSLLKIQPMNLNPRNFSLITLLDVMKKHIFLFSMTTVLMKINEV